MTIINIIEVCMWIMKITHNKCTSQPITIPIDKVTVVPVCTLNPYNVNPYILRPNSALITYPLVLNSELVSEHVSWYDRTLSHGVVSVEAMLLNTVPMLKVDIINTE